MLFTIIAYDLFVFISFANSSAHEYRLLQDLRENYDYFERPVKNSSTALPIKVRLFLNQILDVNWTDYKLIWDPKHYGGISDVRFSGHSTAPIRIWKPDVLLFNSVAETFDSTFSSNFIVKHTGEVIQNPPGILKFGCAIDITWFPFDDQICFLKFGSWTYSGEFIDLDMDLTGMNEGINDTEYSSIPFRDKDDPDSYFVFDSIDRTFYIDNGEWSLL
ncbi:unnamed protein product, partial [Dracunculus medinensis]|uniref:Neur_chan_LBD domain-containing protein n=1 Tax=Dracunculus medinensis TaxID=318479 RepID=A0A0N4UMM6_DRAME